jgi:hypothetical protein
LEGEPDFISDLALGGAQRLPLAGTLTVSVCVDHGGKL